MGSGCSSEQSTAVIAMARIVILQDGQLKEFPCPVKVRQVLQSITDSITMSSPGFVCDSDDLEFGDCVPALDEEKDLSPGKLYFLLPVGYMGRAIRAEEMASLAVKASNALLRCRGRSSSKGPCCGGTTPEEMVLAGHSEGRVMPLEKRVADQNRCRGGGGGQDSLRRRRSSHEYNKGRNLALRLTVISEEE